MAQNNWPYIGNDNLLAPGSTKVRKDVGVYVYKSEKPSGSSKVQVKFGDHISSFVEPYVGAHYYAQTSYANTYSQASMTVNLSDISVSGFKNGRRVRNAFICFAVKTEGSKLRQCDIGLGNGIFTDEYTGRVSADTQNRWTAFAWANNNKPSAATSYNGPTFATATKVDITVSLRNSGGNDYIEGKFVFKNSSNAVVGNSSVTYTGKTGELFLMSGGKPVLRFIRFMSHCPYPGGTAGEKNDDADGTFLRAKMTNLKLDNTVWDKTKLDYVWSVQTANIRNLEISDLTWSPLGRDIDYINLVHDTQLH